MHLCTFRLKEILELNVQQLNVTPSPRYSPSSDISAKPSTATLVGHSDQSPEFDDNTSSQLPHPEDSIKRSPFATLTGQSPQLGTSTVPKPLSTGSPKLHSSNIETATDPNFRRSENKNRAFSVQTPPPESPQPRTAPATKSLYTDRLRPRGPKLGIFTASPNTPQIRAHIPGTFPEPMSPTGGTRQGDISASTTESDSPKLRTSSAVNPSGFRRTGGSQPSAPSSKLVADSGKRSAPKAAGSSHSKSKGKNDEPTHSQIKNEQEFAGLTSFPTPEKKLRTLEPDSEVSRRQMRAVFTEGVVKIDPQKVDKIIGKEDRAKESTEEAIQRWRARNRTSDGSAGRF